MANELHQVQASILRELLFHNGTNFASLNKLGLSNDHFTFHIKKLVDDGFVEKKAKDYFLTQKGKQFSATLDVDSLKLEKMGRPGVAITARKVEKGKTYFLIQQRLKEPLYGRYGLINGKIRFGEMSLETAKRELKEEANLTGEPKELGVYHKIQGPTRDNIKLDIYYFVYLFDNPKGELQSTPEGKNFWFTVDEIKKLKTFTGFYTDLLPKVSLGKPFSYFEVYHRVDNI